MGASRIASYPAPYVELGIALLLTLPAGSFSDFCIGFHIDFNGSSLPSSGSSSGPVICFGFCFLLLLPSKVLSIGKSFLPVPFEDSTGCPSFACVRCSYEDYPTSSSPDSGAILRHFPASVPCILPSSLEEASTFILALSSKGLFWPSLPSAEISKPSEQIPSCTKGTSTAHSLYHTKFVESVSPQCVNQQHFANVNRIKLSHLFQSMTMILMVSISWCCC